MNMIQHSMCNDVLGAPPGVPIEECRALPIMRFLGTEGIGVEGAPYMASFWKPTPEELKLIAEGYPVVLMIQGMTHAPLSVGVAAKKD